MSCTPKGPAYRPLFGTRRRGFLLLEIMPVVIVIGLLALIVFKALNPAKQFGEARNDRRRTDVAALADAVAAYSREVSQTLLRGIPLAPASAVEVCRGASGAGCFSLNVLLGRYLLTIPVDPLAPATGPGQTHYFLLRPAINRITVSAPDTEPVGAPDIEVTR